MAKLKSRFSGFWFCVGLALIGAILAPIFAFLTYFFPSNTSVYINFLRSFEWETLCAGLLGVAGGFAVVAVTRDQVSFEQLKGFKTKFSEIIDARSHLVDVMRRLREVESELARIVDEEETEFLGSSEQSLYLQDKVREVCKGQSREAFKVWVKASWPLPDRAVNALEHIASRLRIRDIWELQRLQIEEMKSGPRLDDYGYEVPPFIGEGENWRSSALIAYSNVKIILKECKVYVEAAESFLSQKANEQRVDIGFS